MSKKIQHMKLNIQILEPIYNLVKKESNDNNQSITDWTTDILIKNLNFKLKDLFGEDGKTELIEKLKEILLAFYKDTDVLIYIQQIYNAKNKEQIWEVSGQVLYTIYPDLNVVERRKYQKLLCLNDKLLEELGDEVLNNNIIRNRISRAKEELNEIFRGV